MANDLAQWTATVADIGDLDQLNGCRIGIEAAHYLNQRYLHDADNREPLLPALGGLPLALQQHIKSDIDAFRTRNIELFFVFSGLDIIAQDDPFHQKQIAAQINVTAWNLYGAHQAEASVAKFGESNYTTAQDLFPALQATLGANDIPFQVAPYSAWAQLAYLQKTNYIHAVVGASEVLLFDCDKIITSWNFDERHFRFVKREKCFADLDKVAGNVRITDDMFVDTCILAGTPFLSTNPILNSTNRVEPIKSHGAIKLITSSGKSGYTAVLNHQEDPRLKAMNYTERYRKARLAIKNHPVYTEDGKIEPLNLSQLPNDAVEYLGRRLPNELFHYMSKGLINPRILQWRTTCEIFETPPTDGGETPDYRALVNSKLIPVRTSTINLLSSTLHNWYRHKDLVQKSWFPDATGKSQETTIRVERQSDTPALVETWNVKEATFKPHVAKFKDWGLLGSAVNVLSDDEFVSKSVGKKDLKNVLSTPDEILYNSIWRFLTIRSFVDSSHKLTLWGEVLVMVVGSLGGRPELEDAAILAVELLRMGLLTSNIGMFPTYNGAPMRGTAKDQEANMLVSRVTGFATLRHKPIGFTGPLSQHLLGYNSIIEAVRQSLRDLLEVTSTHMFLTGCCDRQTDLTSIAMRLPFHLAENCAMSIAVKSYLDEVLSHGGEAPDAAAKSRAVEICDQRYFPQSVGLSEDLKTAFDFWDAVYCGVQHSSKITAPAVRDQWAEIDDWLTKKR